MVSEIERLEDERGVRERKEDFIEVRVPIRNLNSNLNLGALLLPHNTNG